MYRIGSLGDETFDAGDIIGKTLYADTVVPVYNGVPDGTYKPTQVGHVDKGQPVGVVYSWINSDPTKNRNRIWWQFYNDSDGSYYYTEQVGGYYDVSNLKAQGVISNEDKITAQQEADKPWYLQIADQVKPVVITIAVVAIVAGVAGKALFSRKSSNNG